MRKNRKLDEILNDCLERLGRGESVEECARLYPQHSHDLTPLLQVAASTMQTASSIAYRPEARARGLTRLTTAVAERGGRRAPVMPLFGWRPHLAKSLAISLAVVVFTTGTAVSASVASSDSVPGDALYWVKTTRESISLMMPRSDMSRAQAHIDMAKARGEEMGQLALKGRFAEAERLADQIAHQLDLSAGSVGVIGPASPIEMPVATVGFLQDRHAIDLTSRLTRNGETLRGSLLELRLGMPDDKRRKLDMLRHRSELRYRILIAALEGKLAPGWGPLWRAEPAWPNPPRPRGR